MARKCRKCKTELPKAKDCQDGYQKAGFCNVDCMAQHGLRRAREARSKAKKKELRRARERIKTKSEHATEAQRAFNEHIRLRDQELPCISCGRHHNGQYHAGHYRTVGANPELRFEPLNVHKQCAPCNNHKSGNIVEYRINLVARIGRDNVEWLEGPHEPKHYTIDDLKEIKAYYRKLVRDMKRNNNRN